MIITTYLFVDLFLNSYNFLHLLEFLKLISGHLSLVRLNRLNSHP